jgi:hypothetical protein
MATFYATNPLTQRAWSETEPVFKPTGGGAIAMASGTYEILVNPTANDVIRFCKVPKGAIIVAGWINGDDLDTGTETLDIDFGWEANGVEVADTDGLGNMGVLDGDTVGQIIPVAGIWRPLQGTLLTIGPARFSADTWLSALVNVAANATGTGTLTMTVLYVVP